MIENFDPIKFLESYKENNVISGNINSKIMNLEFHLLGIKNEISDKQKELKYREDLFKQKEKPSFLKSLFSKKLREEYKEYKEEQKVIQKLETEIKALEKEREGYQKVIDELMETNTELRGNPIKEEIKKKALELLKNGLKKANNDLKIGNKIKDKSRSK